MNIDDKYRNNPDPKAQLAEIMGKKKTTEKFKPPPELPLIGPLQITLDVPPRDCNPNSRGHWYKLSKAKKGLKSSTVLHCKGQCVPKLYLREANIQTTIYYRTKAHRDEDNAIASMKAAYDGLVQFGLFADDKGMHHLPIKLEHDKDNPRTVVTITK